MIDSISSESDPTLVADEKIWLQHLENAESFANRGSKESTSIGDRIKGWQRLRSDFLSYAEARKQEIRLRLPEGLHQDLDAHCDEHTQRIVFKYFLNPENEGKAMHGNSTVSRSAYATAVLNAHSDLMISLRNAPKNSVQEAINLNFWKKDNNPSITVIRPAPQIQSLVLSAGGVKGIVYSVAFTELSRAGILKNLNTVAASSVGGLIGICITCGMSPEDIEENVAELDIASLKGASSQFFRQYGGIEFGLGLHVGGLVVEKLDRLSAGSVANYLVSKEGVDDMNRLQYEGKLSDDQRARLELLARPNFNEKRTGKMITFADMDLLRQMNPNRFKWLIITGYNQTKQRLEWFDITNTPDLPVAIAGRITMSVPFYFKNVKYNGSAYVDGGVGSCTPAEAVLGEKASYSQNDLPLEMRQQMEEERAKTLVMFFENSGRANRKLFGSPKQREVYAKWAAHLMGTTVKNSRLVESMSQDSNKIYESGPNTLVIHHGDIQTLDLGVSDDRKKMALAVGRKKTLDWIEQHDRQGSYHVFDELNPLLLSFNEEEKLSLKEQKASILERHRDNPEIMPLAEKLFKQLTKLHEQTVKRTAQPGSERTSLNYYKKR
jgi:predicted acylesterase/phospholipase RssA